MRGALAELMIKHIKINKKEQACNQKKMKKEMNETESK
jgi:hypothetical protein